MGSLLCLGVLPAGVALLDGQGYAAVLTVEASDEPHGVLNFALSSRFVLLQEANATVQLFVNREFGSLGLYSFGISGQGPRHFVLFLKFYFKSMKENDLQDRTL